MGVDIKSTPAHFRQAWTRWINKDILETLDSFSRYFQNVVCVIWFFRSRGRVIHIGTWTFVFRAGKKWHRTRVRVRVPGPGPGPGSGSGSRVRGTGGGPGTGGPSRGGDLYKNSVFYKNRDFFWGGSGVPAGRGTYIKIRFFIKTAIFSGGGPGSRPGGGPGRPAGRGPGRVRVPNLDRSPRRKCLVFSRFFPPWK